jgi:hypothetical protein
MSDRDVTALTNVLVRVPAFLVSKGKQKAITIHFFKERR